MYWNLGRNSRAWQDVWRLSEGFNTARGLHYIGRLALDERGRSKRPRGRMEQ